MPATIRDVAKLAGVGLGTVSRVLNNSPLVSEKTRQRVLETIEELNYTPSPIARRLSTGKTQTIAVITPFFTRPAFVERLRGIESSLAESTYDLIIYNVETPERRDACFVDVPRSERVDGVLIVALNPRDSDIPQLQSADVPIVLVDANHPSLTSFNRVTVDDVAGGRAATQHLIELGHRRIGFIGDLLDIRFNFTSSPDRYLGYRQALDQAKIPFVPDYYALGKHGRYEAKRLTEEMLALPTPPTAIFAVSDTQAMGVIEAAQAAGISVPGELSIVGYDDIEIAEFLGLTTIRQLLYESGERGIQLLLRTLTDPEVEPRSEIMPTELIVRTTAAPPRTTDAMSNP
jgi:DNA-binding LacI/PurR family transcriptional regulator